MNYIYSSITNGLNMNSNDTVINILNTLSETMISMNKKIESIESNQIKMSERLNLMNERMNIIESNQIKLNNTIDLMNERMNTIESNQIKTNEKIDILSHDIKETQNYVADRIIDRFISETQQNTKNIILIERKLIEIHGIDAFLQIN